MRERRRQVATLLLLALSLVGFCPAPVAKATGTVLIVNTFSNNAKNGIDAAIARGWLVGGGGPNRDYAVNVCESQSSPDVPVMVQNRLSLVNECQLNNVGYALYDHALPVQSGLDISFNAAIHGVGGVAQADGLVFYLKDGSEGAGYRAPPSIPSVAEPAGEPFYPMGTTTRAQVVSFYQRDIGNLGEKCRIDVDGNPVLFTGSEGEDFFGGICSNIQTNYSTGLHTFQSSYGSNLIGISNVSSLIQTPDLGDLTQVRHGYSYENSIDYLGQILYASNDGQYVKFPTGLEVYVDTSGYLYDSGSPKIPFPSIGDGTASHRINGCNHLADPYYYCSDDPSGIRFTLHDENTWEIEQNGFELWHGLDRRGNPVNIFYDPNSFWHSKGSSIEVKESQDQSGSVVTSFSSGDGNFNSQILDEISVIQHNSELSYETHLGVQHESLAISDAIQSQDSGSFSGMPNRQFAPLVTIEPSTPPSGVAALGTYGGSLGYSHFGNDAATNGVSGALLGIGFDAYGNFYRSPYSGADCINDPHDGGLDPRSLVVRGPQGVDRKHGYCRLETSRDLISSGRNLGVQLGDSALFSTDGVRIRIIIDVQRGVGSVYFGPATSSVVKPIRDNLITEFALPEELVTAGTFKFGFVGGTGGGATNIEVYSVGIQSLESITGSSYSVTYYALEPGVTSMPVDPNSYLSGSNIQLPTSVPARAGYSFAGWQIGGSTYQAGDSYSIADSNVTFTAQWVLAYPVNVGVMSRANPDETSTVTTDSSFAAENEIVNLNVSPLAGNSYIAGTINVSKGNSETLTVTDLGSGAFSFVMPSGAVTIRASFRANPVITFNGNGGFWGSDSSITYNNLILGEVVLGHDPGAPTTPPSEGVQFEGWSTNGQLPAISDAYTLTSDVTLRAIWITNAIALQVQAQSTWYVQKTEEINVKVVDSNDSSQIISAGAGMLSIDAVYSTDSFVHSTITNVCNLPLNNGQLSCDFSPPHTGTYRIYGTYTPDSFWGPMASFVPQTVSKQPSYMSLAVPSLTVGNSVEIIGSANINAGKTIRLSGASGFTFTFTQDGQSSRVSPSSGYSNGAVSVRFAPVSSSPVNVKVEFSGTEIYESSEYNLDVNVGANSPPPSGGGGGTVVVIQQTVAPTITWSPANMVEGDSVGSTQLNAVASVAGRFAYSVQNGFTPKTGDLKVVATFTPDDSSKYSQVITTLTIQVAPKPAPTPIPTPSLSPAVAPSPSPTPTASPTVSPSRKPVVVATPTQTPVEVLPSASVKAAVTLADVKGSITVTPDPSGTSIVATLSSFPVKTSSISKLEVVATNLSTGSEIVAKLPAKTVGTSVVIKGTVPGAKYSVALVYISTTGAVKKLKSSGVALPQVNPSITAPIKTSSGKETAGTKASANSATVQVQNTKKNQRVRVFIGKSDR